jgi:uncharacterized protein YbaR (Trm112 family)
MTITVIFLHDPTPFREVASSFVCPNCGQRYPVEDGVVWHMDRRVDF